MKTQLQLSAAAVRANPRVRPANNNVPPIAVRAPLAGAPLTTGQGQALPLQFARWIFLQFCIFAFLPIFSQTSAPDFTDPRDGETYKTVIMPDGKRWMAENLRYRNGLNNPVFSNVPASSANTFAASKSTYYCPGPGPLNTSVNQADPLACEYWGALYPFWVAYANAANTAVNTTLGEQGICPSGWHLPTDNEWNLLFTKIGGTTDAGRLLKDTVRGTFANNQAWKKQWTNAALQNDNSYGFSALAAGLRTTAGAYFGNGTQALFWTSTPNTNGTQASSKIFTNSSNSSTGSSTQNRADALSVRCVEGGCDEGFRINFVTNTCASTANTTVIYDTVEYLRTSVAWEYRLRVPSATNGIWKYNIDVVSNPTANAPSNLSVRKIVTTRYGFDTLAEFLVKNINLANDNGKTLEVLITASNPNYCNQSLRLFVTLKQYSGSYMSDSRDNKNYKTTFLPDGLGGQKEWMAENLDYRGHGSNTFTYQATPGPAMVSPWGGKGSRTYWCPGVDSTSTATTSDDCDKYGALYTWDCAMWLDGNSANGGIGGTFPANYNATAGNSQVGGRGICPPGGWRIATDDEWGKMLNALETAAGNSLSGSNTGTGEGLRSHNSGSTSTAYWLGTSAGTQLESCTFGGSNKYGFSVRPAGYRNYDGSVFYVRSSNVYFWSASGFDASRAWNRDMTHGSSLVHRYPNNRAKGFLVRCLRD